MDSTLFDAVKVILGAIGALAVVFVNLFVLSLICFSVSVVLLIDCLVKTFGLAVAAVVDEELIGFFAGATLGNGLDTVDAVY